MKRSHRSVNAGLKTLLWLLYSSRNFSESILVVKNLYLYLHSPSAKAKRTEKVVKRFFSSVG